MHHSPHVRRVRRRLFSTPRRFFGARHRALGHRIPVHHTMSHEHIGLRITRSLNLWDLEGVTTDYRGFTFTWQDIHSILTANPGALFEQYRCVKAKFEFFPFFSNTAGNIVATSDSVNTPPSHSGTTTPVATDFNVVSPVPTWVSVLDYDADVVGSTITEVSMMNYSNAHVHHGWKPFSRYFTPATLTNPVATDASVSEPEWKQWFPVDQDQIPYRGLRVRVTGQTGMAFPTACEVRVFLTTWWQFRQMRLVTTLLSALAPIKEDEEVVDQMDSCTM